MEDTASIERATLAAVPPRRQEEWSGWLLPFDDGTVGRCHSAVPLVHAPPPPDSLAHIQRRYAEAGLPAVLRLPEHAAYAGLRRELGLAGSVRSKPTLVQVARADDVARAPAAQVDVQLAQAPGSDWEQVFLGDGFDPVDGASRLAILRRARSSVFASVREDGRTVAVGSACFSEGWCGVHGMRTVPAHRGRGLARALLAALAAQAGGRGIERCFLQVDEANAAARALYARLGFTTAWTYAYWRGA
jgi:ribosomal protein S18 acetylase RimI-like enzyme